MRVEEGSIYDLLVLLMANARSVRPPWPAIATAILRRMTPRQRPRRTETTARPRAGRERAELRGALGIAALGSVGTAVYRGLMSGSVPQGISAAATEAAEATIGGARPPWRVSSPVSWRGNCWTRRGTPLPPPLDVAAVLGASITIATAVIALTSFGAWCGLHCVLLSRRK